MKNLKDAQRILPVFPRTPHLPYHPNLSVDDVLASKDEVSIVFGSEEVWVEEKLDGASVGIYHNEFPLIRNRNHILNKGYVAKNTPAKKQFRPLWNWYYDHANNFKKLAELSGDCAVYGEWMLMQHGIYYDALPSLFIAYDLYDYEQDRFLPTKVARQYFAEAGFVTPPLLFQGKIDSYEQLAKLYEEKSHFSSEKREGIYLRVNGVNRLEHRFKMVRPDFRQGSLFSDILLKNKLAKGN